MADDKLRVGIIGIGGYAAFTHMPQLKAIDQAEVVAISRRNPERLAMAQAAFEVPYAYPDWREMLAQVALDAVVVSTPHHLHSEPTLAALKQGLHVLVEKPMALTSIEAWAMVQAAEEAQRVLMVGYPTRLQGLWRTVKQLIASNTIGRLRQINLAVSYYRRWFWEMDGFPNDVAEILKRIAEVTGLPEQFFSDWGHTWHTNPAQMGGGAFMDLGTHHIDRMLWLADAPAVEVMALTESAGMPVECFVNVQARLANGVLFSMTAADAMPQGLLDGQQAMMIVGDEGILTGDGAGGIWLDQDGQRTKVEPQFADRTVAETFVAAILEGESGYTHAHEGAYAVDFMEALYRSAAEQQIIRLEDARKR